jgi:hypothetical protein
MGVPYSLRAKAFEWEAVLGLRLALSMLEESSPGRTTLLEASSGSVFQIRPWGGFGNVWREASLSGKDQPNMGVSD